MRLNQNNCEILFRIIEIQIPPSTVTVRVEQERVITQIIIVFNNWD